MRRSNQNITVSQTRRSLITGMGLLLVTRQSWAQVENKIGVVMLHGKSPGSNRNPNFGVMQGVLERQGWIVTFPDMPWSRGRYLDGHWDQAMTEIAGHVKNLQGKGANKIVLMGHSMGAPAAMSFAARGGNVNDLVLLAPGHIPRGYYTYPSLKPVRDSIDDARARVAAGKGDEKSRFNDINQGRQQTVHTTSTNFLSYFDPESDADMGITAPRIPPNIPVLTVIGENDPLVSFVRSYFVDKLPPNKKSEFIKVGGGHLDTPRESSSQVVEWIKTNIQAQ